MLNKQNKGFSLLELLIVIAIMGIVGVAVFTGGGVTKKAKKIESDFRNFTDYLNLHKNRTLASGNASFVQVVSNNNNGDITTTVTPYSFNDQVFGTQNTCDFCCNNYTEITNQKKFTTTTSEIKMCVGGTNCLAAMNTSGICFYADGSSRMTKGTSFLMQTKWDTDDGESGDAFQVKVHSATSFFEKLKCIVELNLESDTYCAPGTEGHWQTLK
tara:strand:+ start:29 stop:670 length:642 start_codon:yes stop_codon:yes gene_type:complete